MSVKGLMTTPMDAMSGQASVAAACKQMQRYQAGAVAIVESGKLAGIITYRDVVGVIASNRDLETTRLADVMTTGVDTLSSDGSYGDALRLMVDRDYTYAPVVSGDGALEGLLSLRTLLEHEIDHLAGELDSVTQYLTVDGPGGD